MIVQLGGQTPLKLAAELQAAGIPILGTRPTASTWPRTASGSPSWSTSLALKQPANGLARSRDEAIAVAERIGYPVLLRPSYVLGGRAMEVVDGPEQLDHYIATAVAGVGHLAGADRPLSARRDRGRRRRDLRRQGRRGRRHPPAYRGSGGPFGRQRLLDPALQPVAPRSSPRSSARPAALALALKVKGLMNIQFAVKDEQVYLIEVNPRASRTVPFVAKAIGRPIAKIAARVMAGEKLSAFDPIDRDIGHIAVKESVFPFARFPGTDPVLSPEMKSTGEVMGIDHDFDIAFAKSQLGGGDRPARRRHGVRVGQGHRQGPYHPGGEKLVELGFALIATGGTADHLDARRAAGRAGQQGRAGAAAYRRPDGRRRRSQLVFNTTEGWQSLKDSQSIRATALKRKVPYFTTAAASLAAARAIEALRGHALEVASLQSYYSASVN